MHSLNGLDALFGSTRTTQYDISDRIEIGVRGVCRIYIELVALKQRLHFFSLCHHPILHEIGDG